MTLRRVYLYVIDPCNDPPEAAFARRRQGLVASDEWYRQGKTMTEQTMTIRQMCDAYEVTPRTLRFYETKELLAPIRVGQKRLFTKRDRARLTLILRGKRFGFSLEEIRQLLDLYDLNDGQYTQITRAMEVARGRLAALRAERDAVNAAISELEEQLRCGEKALAERKPHRQAG